MMSLEERVAAAIQAGKKLGEAHVEAMADGHVDEGLIGAWAAQAGVRAAFPELFTTPPQAWMAPWSPSEDDLRKAFNDVRYDAGYGTRKQAYEKFRDSHTKTETG